jgi:hypothetical protein
MQSSQEIYLDIDSTLKDLILQKHGSVEGFLASLLEEEDKSNFQVSKGASNAINEDGSQSKDVLTILCIAGGLSLIAVGGIIAKGVNVLLDMYNESPHNEKVLLEENKAKVNKETNKLEEYKFKELETEVIISGIFKFSYKTRIKK